MLGKYNRIRLASLAKKRADVFTSVDRKDNQFIVSSKCIIRIVIYRYRDRRRTTIRFVKPHNVAFSRTRRRTIESQRLPGNNACMCVATCTTKKHESQKVSTKLLANFALAPTTNYLHMVIINIGLIADPL